jgi:hypothetical protein
MGIFSKKKKTVAEAQTGSGAVAVPEADDENLPVVIAAAVAAADEDEYLPAVIAAAIAAYEAEQFVQTLAIRKINRTAGVRPAWGVTGTTEAIDVRRM